MAKERLGILASGRGSNFQAIMENIELNVLENVDAGVLITDNPEARALEVADHYGVPHQTIEPGERDKEEYEKEIHEILREHDVSLVILAGFMRIVSPYLIENYDKKMMNIHPALLPAFKGLNAQKKALEYGVKITGCTVHYVSKEVDSGPIIVQQAVPVKEGDTVGSLSRRILVFEHRVYSKAIQLHADDKLTVRGRKVKVDADESWKEDWKRREKGFIEHQEKALEEGKVVREIK